MHPNSMEIWKVTAILACSMRVFVVATSLGTVSVAVHHCIELAARQHHCRIPWQASQCHLSSSCVHQTWDPVRSWNHWSASNISNTVVPDDIGNTEPVGFQGNMLNSNNSIDEIEVKSRMCAGFNGSFVVQGAMLGGGMMTRSPGVKIIKTFSSLVTATSAHQRTNCWVCVSCVFASTSSPKTKT